MTSDFAAAHGGLHSGQWKPVFQRSLMAVIDGAGQKEIDTLLSRVHSVDLLLKKAGVKQRDSRYYKDIAELRRDAAMGWLHLAACTLESDGDGAGKKHVSFVHGNAWSATATTGPENVTSTHG